MISSAGNARAASVRRAKCTHSKYRAVVRKTQIIRKCLACGQFCKINAKRRADMILKRLVNDAKSQT